MNPSTVCKFCEKSFASAFNLRRHLLIHSKDSNTFPQKKRIKREVAKVKNPTANFGNKCRICKKIFNSKLNLIKHARTHTAKKNASPSTDHHKNNHRNSSSSFNIKSNYQSGQSDIQKSTVCKFCDKSFASAYNLRRHLRLHKQQNSDYKCGICDKTFYSKQHLIQHAKQLHLNGKAFKCTKCELQFSSIFAISAHISQKHKNVKNVKKVERRHVCKICSKSFRRASDLVCHLPVHSNEKPYSCSVCERSFKYIKNLKVHKKNHTAEELKETSKNDSNVRVQKQNTAKEDTEKVKKLMLDFDKKCPICKETFHTQRHFIRHAQHFHRNGKAFKCSYCTLRFSTINAVHGHSKVHKNCRVSKIQHTCKICSKSFSRKSRLSEHFKKNHADKLTNQKKDQNTHEAKDLSDDDEEEQEEPKQKSLDFENFNNKCAVCHKVFHFKQDFIKHAHRSHRNAKAFQCLHCSLRFSSLKALHSHCRIHTNDSKNYHTCKICSKSFQWKSNLILHSNVHSDERFYCCRLCERSYKSKADMVSHEKAHLDGMYKDHLKYCSLCGNGYKHMRSLRVHQRDKHKIHLETNINLYNTNFNLTNKINNSVAGTNNNNNNDDSSNDCEVKDESLEDCRRNAEFIIPHVTTVTLDDGVKNDEEDVVTIKQNDDDDDDDSIDDVDIKDILEISATEYIPAVAGNLRRKQNNDQTSKFKYIQRSIGKLIMFENKCAVCDKIFNFQKDLIKHVQQYHRNGSAAFKCSQCSSRFCSINSITVHHSRVHSYDNIPTSKNVDNILDDDDDEDEKYEIKEEIPDVADSHFQYNTSTINDILTLSNIPENGQFKENSNTIELPQKQIIENAKKSKEKTRPNRKQTSVQKSKFFENKCAVCDKIFNLSKDLIKHAQQYHRKGKAFQCPLCKAQFNNLQATISHNKIHENLKNLKTSQKLKDKKRLHQNMIGNKANANWRKYLKKQENIQLNPKNNDCAKANTSEIVCEKIDNDGNTCKFCSRSFSHGEYLKVHIDLHHKTCDSNRSIQKDANGTIIQENRKQILSTDQDQLNVSECPSDKRIQKNYENHIGDDKICDTELSFTADCIKTIEVQWLPNINDKKYDYIDECRQPEEPCQMDDENDEQKLNTNKCQMENLIEIDKDNRDDTLNLNSEELKCDICKKNFKNKTKLRRHIGNVHIHNSIYIVNDSDSDPDPETIDIKEESNDAGKYTDQCSSINYEKKDDLINLSNSDQQTNLDQNSNIDINNTDPCAASTIYEKNNQSLIVLEYQIQNPDQLVNVVEYLNITGDHQKISEEKKSNFNAETNIECLSENGLTNIESMNIEEYVNSSENIDEQLSAKDNAVKTTNLVEDKPGIEVIYLNNSLDEVKNVVEVAKNEFVVYDEAIIPESVNTHNHSSAANDSLQNPIAEEEGDNKIENSIKIKIWKKQTEMKRIILTDNKCAVCKKLFHFQRDLTKHAKQFHRNGKAFKCRDCSAQFSNIQAILAHNREVHKKLSKKRSSNGFHLEETLDADIQNPKYTIGTVRKKTYKCEICSKSFTTKNRLTRHHVVHTKKRAYSCTTCNKTYKHLVDLRYHEDKHRLKGRINCDICFRTFGRHSHLKNHVKTHLNNMCPICDKPDLLEHVKGFHTPDDALKCNLCNYHASSLKTFEHHRHVHENFPYSCSMCDRVFKKQINLKKHEKLHFGAETNPNAASIKKGPNKKFKKNPRAKDTQYICEICSKSFNNITYLQGHIKIHKGESPFPCPVCAKGFIERSKMKRHLKLHYMYKCVVCDKNCKTRNDFFKHVNRYHPNHKAFKCRMCEKIFSNIKIFYYHMQAHKNYIPEGLYNQKKDVNRSTAMKEDITTFFTCGFCCKVFKNHWTWKYHVEKHFYNHCQICDKICNSHFDLTKHAEEFHPNEKAFRCRDCYTFLSSSTSLYDHMKIHKSFVNEDPPHSSSSRKETNTVAATILTVNDTPETNETINVEFTSDTEYRFQQDSRKNVDDVENIENNHDIIEELFSQIFDTACTGDEYVNMENLPSADQIEEINQESNINVETEAETNCYINWEFNNDEEKFTCHICSKTLSNFYNLGRHLKTHARNNDENSHINDDDEDKEIFLCDICPKTMSTLGNLKRHLRTHENDNDETEADDDEKNEISTNFTCQICSKTLSSLTCWKRHLKTQTHNLNETKAESNSHNNRETGDDDKKEISTNFTCEICSKSFTSLKGLRRHLKTETHKLNESNSDIKQESNDDDDENKEISKNFICEICSKTLSSEYSLRRHLATHPEDEQQDDENKEISKDFICEICSKTLSTLNRLRRHLKAHEHEAHACEICSMKFSTITKLNNHLPSHTMGRPYACSLCGKTFKREDGLADHKIAKHNILPESDKGNEKVSKKQFTCEICSTSFPTVVLLKRHSSIHTVGRPYVCSLCGKAYKREEGLESHYITIHNLPSEAEKNTDFKEESYEANESASTTKKHTCKICLTSFSSIALLKSHLTIHTVGRPFACSLCGKAFKREEGLENHKLTIHGLPADENTDSKPESNDKGVIKKYNCEECSASFSTMILLKSHLTVHTVGRPYACSLCDKAYKREEGLENHVITVHHLPFETEINIMNSPDPNDEDKEVFIQKFTCDICSVSFSNSTLLKSHLTIHTVGRPHECKLCGKTYKREEGLENHLKNTHDPAYNVEENRE